MKPDWDRLMKEYKGEHGLIADVDCTTDEGKPLCEKVGVEGYPTLKWGDPDSLEAYDGGRDFDALLKFANDKLKPVCSPVNIHLCDSAKKAEIEEMMGKSEAELQKAVDEKEGDIKKAEKKFKMRLEKLQKKYEEFNKEKTEAVEKIKASGLSLMKSVLSAKKKAAKDEL